MFNSKRALLYLIALSLVLLFTALHSFPLTDRDEGEYASCALEMLKSKDFIVPKLNGRPYLEKPILFHWIVASSFKIFGANEFAARLPSAISAFLIVIILSNFLQRYSKDEKIAIFSGLVLITNPLFLIHARACITDSVLTLFITSSLICLFCIFETTTDKKMFLWTLSSIFISLAFLTKGPISLAIFFPVLIIYGWIASNFKLFKPIYLIVFLLCFLTINLPWHLLIYKRLGLEFFETFYFTQNFERFTKTLLGHGGGPFFYLFVIIVGLFPYAQFGIKELIKNLKNKRAGFDLFCAISFLWIFFILSLSATKQLNYILPALPFFAVLTGKRLYNFSKIKRDKIEIIIFSFAAFLFFTIFLIPIFISDSLWQWILGLVRFDSTAYAFPQVMPNVTNWCIIFIFLILFLVIHYLFTKNRFLLTAGALTFTFILSSLFLPTLANKIQGPAKYMAKKIYILKNRCHSTHKIKATSFGLWKPSMIFYTQMTIKRFKVKHIKRLDNTLKENSPIFVFTRTRLLKKLTNESKEFMPIEIKDGYLLGGNRMARDLYRTLDNLGPL